MRATERITKGVIDRSGTDDDLGIIERGKDPGREPNIVPSTMSADKELVRDQLKGRLANGYAIARLYGFPKSKPKKDSQEYEWFKPLGCLFHHMETPYKKDLVERHRALLLGKSTAKEVAERKARIKRIEEGKVVAEIWEPGEDPDRKNDGSGP